MPIRWLLVFLPFIVGITVISIPLVLLNQGAQNGVVSDSSRDDNNKKNQDVEEASSSTGKAQHMDTGLLSINAYPDWAMKNIIQNESQLQSYNYIRLNYSQVSQVPVLLDLLEQAYENREIASCYPGGCNTAVETRINQTEFDAVVRVLGKSNLEVLDTQFQGSVFVGVLYENYIYDILIQPVTLDFSDFIIKSTIVYIDSEKYRFTGRAYDAYSDFDTYELPLHTIAIQSKYLPDGERFALVIEGSPDAVRELANRYSMTEIAQKESFPSNETNTKAFLSYYGMVSKENLLKLLDEITAAYLKENGLTAGALGGVTTDGVQLDTRNQAIEAHAEQIAQELDQFRYEQLKSIVAEFPEGSQKL